ncbi:MazG nucleotide pyrophosphohydrolase domain-containing protein [Paenibacillus elgii]
MKHFEEWVMQFYGQRSWTQYGVFERMGFLMEETGELAQAVRTYEIGRDRPDELEKPEPVLKEELMGELGDVLANLAILADKYGFTLEDAAKAHQEKLLKRFETGPVS